MRCFKKVFFFFLHDEEIKVRGVKLHIKVLVAHYLYCKFTENIFFSVNPL